MYYNLFKLLSNYLILYININTFCIILFNKIVTGEFHNNHLISIFNNCPFELNIYSHENSIFNKICSLQSLEFCQHNYSLLNSGLIKTSLSESATLFEFTIANKGIWYDISVIPPGSGNCYNYNDCKSISNKLGYNHPLEVIVDNNDNTCKNLICLNENCPDAYLYPFDDTKVKFCNRYTNFKLIYCPDTKKNIITNFKNSSLDNFEIDCI